MEEHTWELFFMIFHSTTYIDTQKLGAEFLKQFFCNLVHPKEAALHIEATLYIKAASKIYLIIKSIVFVVVYHACAAMAELRSWRLYILFVGLA